jgi:xanthine/uracil permease
MTGEDLDPYMGRALAGDGVATALASAFGGSPTTTYAENIGVMGATRIYSTAAYYVAAIVAIMLGLSPKFGAVVNAIPGGVLGGITLVLYGMIGLIGAKIWVENNVDFGNPVNLVGLAGGLIAGIGGVTLQITDDFELSGIALGTIMVIVYYHMVKGRTEELAAHHEDHEGALIVGPSGQHNPETHRTDYPHPHDRDGEQTDK